MASADDGEHRVGDPERGCSGQAGVPRPIEPALRIPAHLRSRRRAARSAIAGIAQPEPLAQHRGRVLAEQRRRAVVGERRRRELQRRADLRHGTRRADAAGPSAVPRATSCGSANTWSSRVDRPARNAERLERVEPRTLRARAHDRRRSAAPARRGCARDRRSSRSADRPPTRASRPTSQNFANWPSLPTARIRWPSAQANTW